MPPSTLPWMLRTKKRSPGSTFARSLLESSVISYRRSKPQVIRGLLDRTVSGDEPARTNRDGGWIIPLGAERRIVGGA